MKIFTHFESTYLSNTFVIVDDDGIGVVIDPGQVDKELVSIIETNCEHLAAVLLTDSRPEHSDGVGTLGKIYAFDTYSLSPSAGGLRTKTLSDGDKVKIGRMTIESLYVPGHSMDALAYYLNQAVLFTGDALYSSSIGPVESHVERALLLKSIREKILPLPDNTLIMPSRGPLSRLMIEKMYNQDLLEDEAFCSRSEMTESKRAGS